MPAPIRDAIVVSGPGDADRRVAGVPLLLRTILVLQRGGIERCTIVGADSAPSDGRIRCALDLAATLVPPPDPRLRLVVGAGAVIDAPLVRDLQARARPGAEIDLEVDGARVRVAPGPLIVRNGGRGESPMTGTLRPASTPGLERMLLRGLESPRDGYLDRLLHRHLSRPLTRLLLRTPLSPNTVTVIGIGLGLIGGALLGAPAVPGVVLGIVLLLVSGVLDCCDGELARLRFAESRLGHWLDVSGDTVVQVGVLGGVITRIARTGRLPGAGTLVLLGAGIVISFALVSWSEQTEARRHRVDAWENRLLDGVLAKLTTRDWHVFVIGFALAGRLDLLVPAAAVGAAVFCVVMAVLLLRVATRDPVSGRERKRG